MDLCLCIGARVGVDDAFFRVSFASSLSIKSFIIRVTEWNSQFLRCSLKERCAGRLSLFRLRTLLRIPVSIRSHRNAHGNWIALILVSADLRTLTTQQYYLHANHPLCLHPSPNDYNRDRSTSELNSPQDQHSSLTQHTIVCMDVSIYIYTYTHIYIYIRA